MSEDDPLRLGKQFYVQQGRRNRRAANAVQALWRQADPMDLTGWFEANQVDLVLPMLQGMETSAVQAERYVATQASAQGVKVLGESINPLGFTVELDAAARMAYSASVLPAKEAMAQGLGAQMATTLATKSLVRLTATLVADASREATQAAMVSSRFGGYVRMLQPPSCHRCAVQAGKWFRWNKGFERHPKCDCVHIPAQEARADDLRLDVTAAIRAGKVTGLNKADIAAILNDGADPSQVINAHRGMSTSNVFGQTLKITNEGVTRRGIAHRSMGQAAYVRRQGEMRAAGQRYAQWRSARLSPSAIYNIAESKSDALRLMKLYGYILPD
ncbi:hypothetical protein R4P64_07760 [Rhodococcus sp. IEGM 1366]|uniref:hypothetical protein n=1 Tax=Rhodococcus sp. IEGM 1366 TaxID=3082223 RepID=UPI002953CA3A|nr:hypothetical protein [Rhodococcus sp. IEGM 1366]MDV8066397.1 hypothetical protein [Rhodococcus sp. IEGM 1366]